MKLTIESVLNWGNWLFLKWRNKKLFLAYSYHPSAVPKPSVQSFIEFNPIIWWRLQVWLYILERFSGERFNSFRNPSQASKCLRTACIFLMIWALLFLILCTLLLDVISIFLSVFLTPYMSVKIINCFPLRGHNNTCKCNAAYF